MRNINAYAATDKGRSATRALADKNVCPTTGRATTLELPTTEQTRSGRRSAMSIAIAEFWKLAVESRLLAPSDCQRLEAAFTGVKGAASQGNAATLGEWLAANGTLSRYQVQTLLARRPGPFIFGDYCVYDRIRSKEGRLAGLYRAMHVAAPHPVLLYFLSPEIAGNAEAWQAAAGQIAWACWVGHPFVCECYQLLDVGKFKVVAIENLPGEALGANLTGGVRVAPHDACRLVYQAALGLARLHQLGLVHGEIRPENLWLMPDGNVKLLQVPLAPEPLRGPRPIDWSTPTTKLLTAAEYAAPELAQQGHPPDVLTDIYALGATLYHLIAGAPPFPGNDIEAKIVLHASEPVASLAKYGAPPQLDSVIAYLLAKDPSQRYQQAAQVAEALAYFVDPAALNAMPAVPATLPQFDHWLQQQVRVPGTAPGSIPTGLQMAAHTAAQYAAQQAAAQQAAAQQAAAQHYNAQQAAPPVDDGPPQYDTYGANAGSYSQPAAPAFGYEQSGAPPADQGYFDPASIAPPQFESFTSSAPDPLDFAPPEQNRPQFDLSALDLSSNGGRRAAAEEMLDSFNSPSAAAPLPEVAVAPPPAEVAAPASAPAFNNLDAVIDSAPPKSARAKPVASKKEAAHKSNMLAVGVSGGALAVALIVGIVIAINSGGGSRDGDQNLASTNSSRDVLPRVPAVSITGSKTASTSQPVSSTTGTQKPSTPETNPATSTTGSDARPITKPPSPTGTDTKPPKPSDPVADDGSSLWASPTAGQPLSAKYFAPGVQAVLAVRPANIVRRADGDQILPALGPWGTNAEQALKTLTGLPLAQIDQVMVVWYDPGTGPLVPMLMVRTFEKLAPENLLAAWGNPTAAKEGEEAYYQGQPWCYYLPAKEQGTLLVVAQAAAIKDVIQAAEGTGAMSPHLERMLRSSDADRDLTFVLIPGPALGDSSPMFPGELEALRKPLSGFLGDDAKAGLISVHVAGNFFIELKVLGTTEKTPESLASQYANRVRALPETVEDGLLKLNLHPYAKKLLFRFPGQLRVLAENTRSDVDDDMALLRCYLPSVATHNLILASEVALAEQPVAAGAAGGANDKPVSIAELLQKKTTLTFPRDTLEKSLQMLLDEAGVKYEILGGDLQLEGITKNQSFGLDEKDKSAGEILRKIMLLANPDGKLVYVIKPKAPGGPEMLFVTTRASAAKRGDKLPPELQQTGPTKTPPGKTPPKK